jgi:hypothetical protein
VSDRAKEPVRWERRVALRSDASAENPGIFVIGISQLLMVVVQRPGCWNLYFRNKRTTLAQCHEDRLPLRERGRSSGKVNEASAEKPGIQVVCMAGLLETWKLLP